MTHHTQAPPVLANDLFGYDSTVPASWWGMPLYEMSDSRPQYRVVMNFMTREDLAEFSRRLGIRVTPESDTAWYPSRVAGGRTWEYVPRTRCRVHTRYPIYVLSKGRWGNPLTARCLKSMKCDFYFVVEENEAAHYRRLKLGKILVLPFSDLGAGSIPARNWIWAHALSLGVARHWIFDDNIRGFYRLNFNQRIPVRTGQIFCAMEDFTDRYENVAFSGLHNVGFIDARRPDTAPYTLNSRIYSMTLVNNSLPYRWRGRYNEDTDICLRALKDGWCTILFNMFLGDKVTTMQMPGGNTDTVYRGGDRRLNFAKSLQKQHPDCVTVVWRFNRWHHSVNYSRFKSNKLVPRADLVHSQESNEYDMCLRAVD